MLVAKFRYILYSSLMFFRLSRFASLPVALAFFLSSCIPYNVFFSLALFSLVGLSHFFLSGLAAPLYLASLCSDLVRFPPFACLALHFRCGGWWRETCHHS